MLDLAEEISKSRKGGINLENKPKSFSMAGGLGNQLFIFTAGSYYSIHNSEIVFFDVSSYANGIAPHGSDIRLLNPDVIFLNRRRKWLIKFWLKKFLNRDIFSIYSSPRLGYDPALESKILEKQIFGYFQTYKYLENPKVRELLDSLNLSSTSTWFETSSAGMLANSTISVHIRRGDYLFSRDSFGLLAIEYYQSALEFTLKNSSNRYTRILVFSDDVVLAKQLISNLEVSLPVQFAESEINKPEETLMLMAKSDALIMSNSSFSWWAAQLGNKAKFVVCPSKWFRIGLDPEELVPPEWHLMDSQWEI